MKLLWQIERFEIRPALSQSAIALGLSCLLPFIFHWFPVWGSVPQGVRWLPIFYAPLLALLSGSFFAAVICGLLAPLLNFLLFGMPQAGMLGMLTADLLGFSLIFSALYRFFPRFLGLSPAAYILAKGFNVFWGWIPAKEAALQVRFEFFIKVLSWAWPGLCVFIFIHFLYLMFAARHD